MDEENDPVDGLIGGLGDAAGEPDLIEGLVDLGGHFGGEDFDLTVCVCVE